MQSITTPVNTQTIYLQLLNEQLMTYRTIYDDIEEVWSSFSDIMGINYNYYDKSTTHFYVYSY